jgi:hypothetical protein
MPSFNFKQENTRRSEEGFVYLRGKYEDIFT